MSAESESNFPWTVLSDDASSWQQRTFIFYGPSGAGKTYLAAQFPDPLFLSCDPGVLGGALSAAKFHPKQIKINSYTELINLIPTLKANAGTEFKTLVVDSVTYLGRLVMNNILTTVGREIPRFEEWNLNATRLRRLIENLSNMNCHLVLNAVDLIKEDKVTGKTSGGPSLPGQLQTELPQAVDVCCRLFATSSYNNQGKLEVKYKFRSVPDDTWFAKDRTSLLPAEGESVFSTFSKMFTEDELKK